MRVRLRRPGRDLRARHGARGDLRPPGFRGAVASASRSAFLASSGLSRSGFFRPGFCWPEYTRPGFCWPEYTSRGCADRCLGDRGLGGSGGYPGRWRRGVVGRGVLDGVDRGGGGVLRRVLDGVGRILDGFVGDGCCVPNWSGGYERSRHRGVGSCRHDRVSRFRSQRPGTERSPAECSRAQRYVGECPRAQRRSGEHSRGQRFPSQHSSGQRSRGQYACA
ncbi:MAG TPA: hypothetical protein VFV73_37560 [Streptosporangiaceae bacterium]|nr:hypothetical protein [Streptosporangiaceae bacterium]